MKSKENTTQQIELNDTMKDWIIQFLERKDVCIASVARETGIYASKLRNLNKFKSLKAEEFKKLRNIVANGKPVKRKRRECHDLAKVPSYLQQNIKEYIEQDDVCVSSVERKYGLTSGTLRRFSSKETRHTKPAVIKKLKKIVSKGAKAEPRKSYMKLVPSKVITQFINQRLEAPEIAKKSGTSREAVYRILRNRGIQMCAPASEISKAVRKYCKKHNISISAFCEHNNISSSFMYSKGDINIHRAQKIRELLEKPPTGIPKASLNPQKVDELKKEGLTHAEIAEELGVHIVTVSRANKKLKKAKNKQKK